MVIKDVASVMIASTSVVLFLAILIWKNLMNQPDNNTCEGNVMAFIFFSFVPFFVFVDGKNTGPVDKLTYILILSVAIFFMSLFLSIILKKKREFESHFWKKIVTLLIYIITVINIIVYAYRLKQPQLLTFFNYIICCTVIILLLCAYRRKKIELSIYLSIFMFFTLNFSMLIEHIFNSSCEDLQTKQIIYAILTLVVIIVVALYKTQNGEQTVSKYKKIKKVELKETLNPEKDDNEDE